jgi:hypothetical protein
MGMDASIIVGGKVTPAVKARIEQFRGGINPDVGQSAVFVLWGGIFRSQAQDLFSSILGPAHKGQEEQDGIRFPAVPERLPYPPDSSEVAKLIEEVRFYQREGMSVWWSQ